MASDFPDADITIETIERRVFEYMLDKIGGTEDEDGFIGKFRRRLLVTDDKEPDDAEDVMWMIRMTGDGNRENFQVGVTQTPKGCHVMGLDFIAVSTSRKYVQRIAGVAMSVFPADMDSDDKLTNVRSVFIQSMPSFEDITIQRIEGKTGGDVEAWRMEMRLDCVFHNVEQ